MSTVPKDLVIQQWVPKKSITEIIREHTQVQAALDRGFYTAVLRHRAANVPMVFAEDGRIVHVDAHEIPIPEDILLELTGENATR